MDHLLDGVARYQSDVHPTNAPLFEELSGGQQPDVFFIACSDSRVDPSLITQQLPGQLFIARNAGNIVPSALTQDLNPDGISAALEYAVAVLGVGNIVVCGHSDCGAMKAALSPESLAGTTYLRSWIDHARDAVESPTDDVGAVIQRNVLVQLENLMSYGFVAERVREGTLTLHGWVYDIGTGHVAIHDGDTFA